MTLHVVLLVLAVTLSPASSHSSPTIENKKQLAEEVRILTREATRLAGRVAELSDRLDGLYGEPRRIGSVYVRWGHNECPDTSEKVYSGVVAGGEHAHSGAGVNALCMTVTPEYSDHQIAVSTVLYGAEYQTNGEAQYNYDVVCAKCLSPRPVTDMIPGRLTCLPDWTKEYSGFLMAGYHNHKSSTEFLCMDADKKTDHASHENHNGKLFYYVKGQCGSLPCPPYKHDMLITCVVCSK